MLPIASNIATRAVRQVAESALPGAGVIPDAQPRDSRIRAGFAAILRRSAQRRNRLAERLDPVRACTPTRAPSYAAAVGAPRQRNAPTPRRTI